MRDSPLIEQEIRPVYLTNGIGEFHLGPEALHEPLGLSSGTWQNEWNPLTVAEQNILGGGFWMPSGFLAMCSYSVVYEGRKLVAVSIEYSEDDQQGDAVELYRLYGVMLKEATACFDNVTRAGGIVWCDFWASEYFHTLLLLFPFDDVVEKFSDRDSFADWVAGVVGGKQS